jgi:lysophospholipid acyltransferase (LPLAT)-like uncharacterized protein
LIGATWIIRQSDLTGYFKRLNGSTERLVYSIWHRDILPLCYFGRGEGVTVLISQHRDGEIIARVAEKLGFSVFRGSTTRGGVGALRALDRIKESSDCDLAFTPDGPRGPAKKLQKGVIYAASRTGFPVAPVGVALDRAWVFSSWDGFRVPKPFSRCYIQIDKGIEVPADLSDDELEHYRSQVEASMHAAEEKARAKLREWT